MRHIHYYEPWVSEDSPEAYQAMLPHQALAAMGLLQLYWQLAERSRAQSLASQQLPAAQQAETVKYCLTLAYENLPYWHLVPDLRH